MNFNPRLTLAILATGLALTVAYSMPASPASGADELIQVDVQVIEVNKSRMMSLGLDWRRLLQGGTGGIGPAGPLEFIEDMPQEVGKLESFDRGRVEAFVRMLQENDYGRLLAKPKLLTTSGSSANFLVGGELPIVTVNAVGSTSISWKDYGVKLKVKPERTGDMIRTQVRAEFSTVDPINAVVLPQGTYVPSLKSRWAETDVKLPSRATVIIAGLIQEEQIKVAAGVPFLSELPVLGWLFRHTRMQEIETELVIFVTPSVVGGPAAPGGS